MKLIPLTRGLSTVVDDDVYEWASKFNWIAQPTGASFYVARRGNVRYGEDRKKLLLLHRLITGAAPGQNVDHKNRDPLDNRTENLRLATNGQNMTNRRTKKKCRAGSLKGVCHVPELNKTNQWMAYYTVNGKRVHVGYFATEQAAHAAYVAAASKAQGEFFCLE